MNTDLDAGSQGWNNALWQELPPHGLALHNQVTQCVQAELLRADNTNQAWSPLQRVRAPDLEALGRGECSVTLLG